jgi:hypothetical protein
MPPSLLFVVVDDASAFDAWMAGDAPAVVPAIGHAVLPATAALNGEAAAAFLATLVTQQQALCAAAMGGSNAEAVNVVRSSSCDESLSAAVAAAVRGAPQETIVFLFPSGDTVLCPTASPADAGGTPSPLSFMPRQQSWQPAGDAPSVCVAYVVWHPTLTRRQPYGDGGAVTAVALRRLPALLGHCHAAGLIAEMMHKCGLAPKYGS